MKIRYQSAGGRLVFESDLANPKEAFEWLATVHELFEEAACGLCGQSRLAYEVREFDGNNYYKLVCRDCHATLDFGQRRDGSNLFIKRKDAEGNPLPNQGWYRYQGAAARATAAPPPASRRDAVRRESNASPQAEAIPF
jgi:hypothetical protein